MKKLIIISFDDTMMSHKKDIKKSLEVEKKHGVINNISYMNNLGLDIVEIIKESKDFDELIIVFESGIKVDKDVFKFIKKNVEKPLWFYKYDSSSKFDNLVEKLQLVSKDKDNNIEDELLKLYSDGYSDEYIEELFSELSMTFDDLVNIIVAKHIKGNSNRLSDDLKMAVSNRDKNGISRKSIAKELDVTYKTIQRACEKYGNPNKNMERVDEENVSEFLTENYQIDNKTKILICPKCNRKTSKIDTGWSTETYYCRHCLEEYSIRFKNGKKQLYRVKWENIN